MTAHPPSLTLLTQTSIHPNKSLVTISRPALIRLNLPFIPTPQCSPRSPHHNRKHPPLTPKHPIPYLPNNPSKQNDRPNNNLTLHNPLPSYPSKRSTVRSTPRSGFSTHPSCPSYRKVALFKSSLTRIRSKLLLVLVLPSPWFP